MMPATFRLASIALGTALLANQARAHTPTSFVEVPQVVQFDGEYSPPAGRIAPMGVSATRAIKSLKPWEKDIPIIVNKAPLVVTESQYAQMMARKQTSEGASTPSASTPAPTSSSVQAVPYDMSQMMKSIGAQTSTPTSAPITTTTSGIASALPALGTPQALPSTPMLNATTPDFSNLAAPAL